MTLDSLTAATVRRLLPRSRSARSRRPSIGKGPIEEPIEGGVLGHELWHTDGAKLDYNDIFGKTGITLTKKPGYKSGARDAFRAFLRCLRFGREKITSQVECDTLLKDCWNTHVSAPKIAAGGWFHEFIAPREGVNAQYGWKNSKEDITGISE